MDIKVGTKLQIGSLSGQVIGYIEYANRSDRNLRWTEYRLKTNEGERWLSVDEHYKEYSVSKAENKVGGNIGPEWKKVDEGQQVVVSYAGDVDVDMGEKAEFVEFEDETEEKTLSVEIWPDGTEYSTGYYVDLEEIVITGYEQPPMITKANSKSMFTVLMILFIVGSFISEFAGALTGLIGGGKKIGDYLKKESLYSYVTSITGNEKQKADVYEFSVAETTDYVAKDIIDGIEGNTESVTQKDEKADEEIAIVTKKEYCLIYHPEENPDRVYVQISPRKYNYTSDNAPYKASRAGTSWYRSHYFSSSYAKDSSSFKKMPSAYTAYQGDTIHNIGNGYFDTYSSSVRQSSINSRNSSSGGGK